MKSVVMGLLKKPEKGVRPRRNGSPEAHRISQEKGSDPFFNSPVISSFQVPSFSADNYVEQSWSSLNLSVLCELCVSPLNLNMNKAFSFVILNGSAPSSLPNGYSSYSLNPASLRLCERFSCLLLPLRSLRSSCLADLSGRSFPSEGRSHAKADARAFFLFS